MKKSVRFPLHFRIWLIASGAVFAVSIGLQLFFSRMNYGFIYNNALLLVCYVSFGVLLTGLTVWLCRRVLKRQAMQVLVWVAFALILYYLVWLGCASMKQYLVHISPGGTNRVAVINIPPGSIYAYPMLNSWIYRRVANGCVRGASEYTVEWPTEKQAVVTAISWLPDDQNESTRIIVDFE